TDASYTLKAYGSDNLTSAGGATSGFSLPANLTTVNTLTLNTGVLSLSGYNLTANTLVNLATLRLQGNETVSITNGNDTAEGMWEYVGDGPGGLSSFIVKDWGATDYYNLKINPADPTETFNVTSALKLNGTLTYSAGTLNLRANVP